MKRGSKGVGGLESEVLGPCWVEEEEVALWNTPILRSTTNADYLTVPVQRMDLG